MITWSQPTTHSKAPQTERASKISQPFQGQYSHSMVTRFKLGVVKPNPKYALTSISSHSVPREPWNVQSALAHPYPKYALDMWLV
jgi:hypothetical protein